MADIISNLILHAKLDETSGTVAADSSGNGNDGTLANLTFDADGVPGKYGGAVQRMVANEHVSFGSLGLTDADQTIAFWIRFDGVFGAVFPISARDGTDGGLSIYIASATTLRAIIGITSNTNVVMPDISGGGYHHIAVCYTAAPRALSYYVDGVLVGLDATVGGTWNEAGLATQLFERVGGTSGLDLTMDDVRIYSRELSAADVWMLAKNPYNAARKRQQLLVPTDY